MLQLELVPASQDGAEPKRPTVEEVAYLGVMSGRAETGGELPRCPVVASAHTRGDHQDPGEIAGAEGRSSLPAPTHDCAA